MLGGGKTILKDFFASFSSCVLLFVLFVILDDAKYLLYCQISYQPFSISFGLKVAGKPVL